MRRLGLVAALGLAAACGSDLAGPGAEPPFDFELTDPAGDTVAAAANPGGSKGIDLRRVSGRLSPTELSLTLEFAEDVTRWSDGAPNGLDGFVYLDVDQNAPSGFPDSRQAVGVDFYLDLRDNGSGKVAIVDVATRRFITVPATFGGTSVSVTIKRSAITLDRDTNSALQLAVEVSARGRTPVVDRAPNDSWFVVRPPATP